MSGPGRPRPAAGAVGWRLVGAVVFGALGVLLGCCGAFLTPAGPRIGTGPPISVGVAVAVVGNVAASWLALQASGSRIFALWPTLTWGVVAIYLGSTRANGSLILTGGGLAVPTELFLLLGFLAGIVTAGLARDRRRPPPGAGGGR